jgi:hypothetical protein
MPAAALVLYQAAGAAYTSYRTGSISRQDASLGHKSLPKKRSKLKADIIIGYWRRPTKDRDDVHKTKSTSTTAI